MIKDTKNLSKIGNSYYIRYTVNKKTIKKCLNTKRLDEAKKKRDDILSAVKDLKTETDVIQKVGRAKKLCSNKKFPISKVWNNFEEYLIRHNKSANAISNYRRYTNFFLDWLKTNYSSIVYLNDFNDSIAMNYSKYLNSTKLANKTYNEKLNAVRLLFEALQEETNLIKNPFRKELLPRKTNNTNSKKEFTESEVLCILDNIQNLSLDNINEVELLFYIGTYTGMRLKDCCLLKWDSVNFNDQEIAVIPNKTKRFRTHVLIPVLPDLLKKLLEAKKWKYNEFVLPNIASRYLNNRENIGKITRKVILQSGFEPSKVNIGSNGEKLRSISQYGFHSLRYMFITACARSGVSI
ncbi:MAG: tyrosine-type recombinase/integrase, partial [bacterium]|nr:tyrosine-type recombinase/integrase [bacterium]